MNLKVYNVLAALDPCEIYRFRSCCALVMLVMLVLHVMLKACQGLSLLSFSLSLSLSLSLFLFRYYKKYEQDDYVCSITHEMMTEPYMTPW